MTKKEIDKLWKEADELQNNAQIKEAVEVYKRIAELGDTRAYNSIGYLYDLLFDDENSIKYFKLAVAEGSICAMCNLCNKYYFDDMFNEVIDLSKDVIFKYYLYLDDYVFLTDIFLITIKAYYKLNKVDEAKELYEKYKNLAQEEDEEIEELFSGEVND